MTEKMEVGNPHNPINVGAIMAIIPPIMNLVMMIMILKMVFSMLKEV